MAYKIERHAGKFFGNVTVTAPNGQQYSLTISRHNQVLDILTVCKNGVKRQVIKGGATWMRVKDAYYENGEAS